MITNARLIPDSLNALTLQVTSQTKDTTHDETEVYTPVSRLRKIVEAIKYAIDHRDEQSNIQMILVIDEADSIQLVIQNANSEENRLLSLDKAVEALSPVRGDITIATQHMMLGKRKFDLESRDYVKRDSSFLF